MRGGHDMTKSLAALAVVLAALLMWAAPECAFGVAISPGSIEATNVLRGSDVTRGLTIFNDSPKEQKYTFVGQTMPLAGWVTVHDIKSGVAIRSVSVPPRSSRSVNVVVKVPRTAANGRYKATLSAEPEVPAGEGVGAVLVPSLLLNISVTDKEIIDLELESLIVSPIEVGSPLQIDASARSDSNVEVAPTLLFGVVGSDGKVLRQAEFDMSPIPVHMSGRDRFSLGMDDLKTGEYRTYGQLRYGKTVTAKQWTTFAVVPPGTFAKAELKDFAISGSRKVGGEATLRATLSSLSPKPLEPKLVADIYRNGLKIGSVEGKRQSVDPYRQLKVVLAVPIEKPGAYRIDAYFVFSDRETNHATGSFRTTNLLVTSGLVAIGVALLLGCVAYVWSRNATEAGRRGQGSSSRRSRGGRHRQGGAGPHVADAGHSGDEVGHSEGDAQPRLSAG